MAYDWLLATRVRVALEGLGGAAEQPMMGALCFLRRGHMCCGVSGDRLMVRLGPAQAAAALGDPQVELLDIGGGRKANAFVTIAPEAVADDASLTAWVTRGVQFADGLPEKAQRRK